uniref:G protein RHOBTB-like protein n=1 Tax=Oikopleura dioica TaxID=34765 RepID=Q676B8_OIKDI|nr:G protein RHOBTB-like protein [Oikopleura dioica]
MDLDFKIVVVGDVNVGKTRLICSRAYRKTACLDKIRTPAHASSVWAIDQRLSELWNSHRLWDTFGAHDRDRRFAFGHADVVLLCFSIASENSLRNIKAPLKKLTNFWIHETRQHLKSVPQFVVGCKADLRHCNLDEFNARCGQLATKVAFKSELSLSLPYYETSVVTGDGVEDLFTNAIRAALLTRRRFWRSHLKSVQRPLPQPPLLPPMPPDCDRISESSKHLALPAAAITGRSQSSPEPECDLPSFDTFFDFERYSDGNSENCSIPLHRCIIASRTRIPFEEKFNEDFIKLVYCGGFTNDSRIFTNVESRAARLNMFHTGKYSDVTLIADDGEIKAHRILLAAGSELMNAMLIGHWRESSLSTIRMTDLKRDELRECCRWIYARVMPDWSTPTKLLIQLIPAASRLCMSEFFSRLEAQIIERIRTSPSSIGLQFSMTALELAEQHHANRLAAFITRHLSVNFNEIHEFHREQFLELEEAKRVIIEKERWPPTWYMKERDLYERTIKNIKNRDQKKHPVFTRVLCGAGSSFFMKNTFFYFLRIFCSFIPSIF